MKNSEINIRDPFVLVHGKKYYLYGTRGKTAWGNAAGFDVYISESLNGEWEGPIEVLDSAKYGLDTGPNWAPEVHFYNGAFYMFATFKQKSGHIGTYILRADSPKGPFEPHSEEAITKYDWKSLDGTLYISNNGVPYMVFCHEWVQIKNGTICAVELSDDFKKAVGEPFILFKGSDPSWAEKASENYVTDGPFLHRLESGALILIWSSVASGNYVQAVAVSDNADIDGRWINKEELLFQEDGGHGMIFKTLDNQLMLTLHSPNKTLLERPKFIELTQNKDGIFIK